MKYSELLKQYGAIELDDPVVQPDRWFFYGFVVGFIVAALLFWVC